MSDEVDNFIFDLTSELEEMRIRACRVLAQIGCESAIAPLREATRDEAPAVRYYAGKALNAVKMRMVAASGKIPVERETLAERAERQKLTEGEYLQYLSDPEDKTRLEAIGSSVTCSLFFGDGKILHKLLERLEQEDNTFILSSLIKSVGLLGDDSVIPILTRYLRHKNPRVRANTIESLGYMNLKDVFPLIIPMLEDSDHRVMTSAVIALQDCDQVNVMDTVARMLNSDKVWMRDSAAYALGEIKTDESADMLFGMIEWEPKYGICLKAVRSLEKIGTRTILPRAIKLRSSLGDPRKKSIAEYLIKRLLGQEVDIRDYFDENAMFIARPEGYDGQETDNLSAYDKEAFRLYNEGLRAIESQEFIVAAELFQKIVLDYSESGWASICGHMLETIGERKEEDEDEEIPVTESDSESEEEVLETGKDTEDVVATVESLIHDLSNPDEEIRRNTVIKLMAIDDSQAIKPLTRAAMDKDSVVRYFAKRALRRFQVESEDSQ